MDALLPGYYVLATLLGAVIIFFAFPFVATPVLVRMMLRFRLPFEVVPVDPRVTPLPEDTRQYFDYVYQQMATAGFELRGVMYLPSFVSNVRALIAVYVNRSTSDAAIASFIVAEGPAASARKRHVEFVRRFQDDTVVQTSNSDELSPFPANPKEYTTQFFGLEDVKELWALHQFLAAKHGKGRQPVLRIDSEFAGRETEYITHVVLHEHLVKQIKPGYLILTPTEFRPTWKGCMLMGWKETAYVKAWRRWKRRKAAREIRQEYAAQKSAA